MKKRKQMVMNKNIICVLLTHQQFYDIFIYCSFFSYSFIGLESIRYTRLLNQTNKILFLLIVNKSMRNHEYQRMQIQYWYILRWIKVVFAHILNSRYFIICEGFFLKISNDFIHMLKTECFNRRINQLFIKV